MLGVIISAVAIIMLGYLCVGLAGYLAFPTTVASNVLLSFSQHDWLMQARPHADRPTLTFQLCQPGIDALADAAGALFDREGQERGGASHTVRGACFWQGSCRLSLCLVRV